MSVRKVVPLDKAEWRIAPLPAWVVVRDPDWTELPVGEHAVTFPLIDEQHHSATQARNCRSIRRLHTHAAVQSLGQVEVDFDPAADRLLIHDLVVWRQAADGTWDKRSLAHPDAFLLRQREQQLEQQMLHGRLSVVALLEDVRVGDAIELSWTTEPVERLPGLKFTAFYAFAWSVPVARASFAIHRDPSVPLKWRRHLPPAGAVPTEVETPELVTWTMERPEVFKPEANVPGSHWAFPLLEISAWESWTEVAAFIAELWTEALADAAEAMAAEAARLRAAHSDAKDAARAAIRFVQEEIRYLAVDFGHGGGMLPNAAGTVLRRRFGDCKDKSVLLTALLRQLGFEAWPLLVGAGWREAVARVQPSPSAFSHAIVTFLVGEKRVFIDPTLLGQGGDLADLVAPPYGCGLEVRRDSPGLLNLPPLPPASLSLTETFYLDRKKGNGTLHQQLRATSWLADEVRGAHLRQGAAAFLQTRVETLQRQFPALIGSTEPALVIDPPHENSFDWSVTHQLPTWGPSGQKPPPMFTYGAHGLMLAVDVVEGHERRLQPWELRHPIKVHHRVVVRGKCVRRPKDEHHRVDGVGFRYTCDVGSRRGEVTFDYRWETTASEIKPEQWRQYVEDREKAFQHAGANVVADGRITPKQRLLATLGVAVCAAALGVVNSNQQSGDTPRRPPSSTSERRGIEADVAKAFEMARNGDHAKAEPILRDYAPYYTDQYDYQLVYAEALLNTGHLDEVPPLITRLRRLKPGEVSTDLVEATLLEKRGEYSLARNAFRQILAQHPEDLHALHGFARISESLSDYAAARTGWERFLALRPTEPDVLLRYALMLWSQGAKSRADEVITGVLRAQPVPSAPLEATLSDFYNLTNRPAEAVAPAKRACDLAPNDPRFLARYSTMLLRSGDAAGALQLSRENVKKLPHPLLWRALAISAGAAGENDEAERAFKEWMRLSPNDPDMFSDYGFFLHRAGRNTEARRVMEDALRKFPAAGLLWLNYAVTLEALGDPAAAEARRKAEALTTATQRDTLVR